MMMDLTPWPPSLKGWGNNGRTNAVFKWLHRFFYSDDPDVRFADGLSEFDAAQYHELLVNSGIMSMAKNMNALHGNYGGPVTWANDYALFVKQSDVEASYDVLGHLLARFETQEAREVRRQLRAGKQGEA